MIFLTEVDYVPCEVRTEYIQNVGVFILAFKRANMYQLCRCSVLLQHLNPSLSCCPPCELWRARNHTWTAITYHVQPYRWA
jgi:hypothetical protein